MGFCSVFNSDPSPKSHSYVGALAQDVAVAAAAKLSGVAGAPVAATVAVASTLHGAAPAHTDTLSEPELSHSRYQ